MKKYQAILFDLFGTVALFDHNKLPIFEWNGQTSRSTMGRLRLLYEEETREVPFAHFFSTLSDVSEYLTTERSRSLREFSSVHRFSQTLLQAGFSSSPETQAFAEQLALAHMAILASATAVPGEYADFLAQVKQVYPLALVSNFDHAPTAREVLRTGGVDTHFQHIVVSDEHGWRKPHPKIFSDTLTVLGVAAADTLFVGDSPHDDVLGAKEAGMDVAWVNAQDAALPAGVPAPDYTIRAIPELSGLLF